MGCRDKNGDGKTRGTINPRQSRKLDQYSILASNLDKLFDYISFVFLLRIQKASSFTSLFNIPHFVLSTLAVKEQCFREIRDLKKKGRK